MHARARTDACEDRAPRRPLYRVAPLDQRTGALTRLAALIALDGHGASFIATVQDAQGAGASDAEIVATLLAVLPSAGVVRASSAASKIALALGYEPDPALLDDDLDQANARRVSKSFLE